MIPFDFTLPESLYKQQIDSRIRLCMLCAVPTYDHTHISHTPGPGFFALN
jgi:hypothetical protein